MYIEAEERLGPGNYCKTFLPFPYTLGDFVELSDKATEEESVQAVAGLTLASEDAPEEPSASG